MENTKQQLPETEQVLQAAPSEQEPSAQVPADDDNMIFQALEKQKKRKRRKRLIIIIVILILLAVGGFVGMQVAKRVVRTQFAGSSEEILSAAAERGSISTVVSASGMLVNVGTQTVTVPAGVTVTELLVKYGDTVQEGDMLAVVDMASVRTAMSSLQKEIETLDKEIASATSETVSSTISAGVSGRLKAVYAQKGDLVEDVMVDHGGLALISLDGYMAVEIETDRLTAGATVSVVRAAGGTLTGTVESAFGSKAVILVTDNGPKPDEEVTVYTTNGEVLGSGKLYVHNPLVITGYAGTVNYVNATVEQQVYAYTTLYQLTDTKTTVNYDALLRERTTYEETLLELLQLQRYGGLICPISGSVYSTVTLDELDTTAEATVVTLSPDVSMEVTLTVSESDILSLSVGQRADITVRSLGSTSITGTVTEIDKTYTSGSYTAVVTMDKVSGMIPGMTASVDIRIQGVDDAILIPADALNQTSTGYFVYTSYDTETKEYGGKVTVIPGLSNSNYVEIKSGLSVGDTVYYTKAQTFSFGSGMPGFGSGNSGSGFGGGQSGSTRPSGSGNSGNSGSNRPSGNSGGGNGGNGSSGAPSGFGG